MAPNCKQIKAVPLSNCRTKQHKKSHLSCAYFGFFESQPRDEHDNVAPCYCSHQYLIIWSARKNFTDAARLTASNAITCIPVLNAVYLTEILYLLSGNSCRIVPHSQSLEMKMKVECASEASYDLLTWQGQIACRVTRNTGAYSGATGQQGKQTSVSFVILSVDLRQGRGGEGRRGEKRGREGRREEARGGKMWNGEAEQKSLRRGDSSRLR